MTEVSLFTWMVILAYVIIRLNSKQFHPCTSSIFPFHSVLSWFVKVQSILKFSKSLKTRNIANWNLETVNTYTYRLIFCTFLNIEVEYYTFTILGPFNMTCRKESLQKAWLAKSIKVTLDPIIPLHQMHFTNSTVL